LFRGDTFLHPVRRIPAEFIREHARKMAKQVASFNELVDYLKSCKIEDSDAVHIAEHFMDTSQVQFDADGNFAALDVEYDAGSKTVVKK